MKDFKTLVDADSTITVAKKELEIAKQLWEKQLREIQSRQQASQKMSQKPQSKSSTGKPKEVKKSSQARDKKGAKEGMNNGSKQSPKVQQSMAGLQSDARTSKSGIGEGESLLSAAKTTYFKDKKAESDSGVQRRRVQVVVKDGNSSSSEEEEEKGEGGEGGGSNGEEKVSTERPITTKPVQVKLVLLNI